MTALLTANIGNKQGGYSISQLSTWYRTYYCIVALIDTSSHNQFPIRAALLVLWHPTNNIRSAVGAAKVLLCLMPKLSANSCVSLETISKRRTSKVCHQSAKERVKVGRRWRLYSHHCWVGILTWCNVMHHQLRSPHHHDARWCLMCSHDDECFPSPSLSHRVPSCNHNGPGANPSMHRVVPVARRITTRLVWERKGWMVLLPWTAIINATTTKSFTFEKELINHHGGHFRKRQ